MHVKVLWVVDIAIRTVHDAVDDSRFEVQHNRARYISRVVGLVEENIFAIAASVRAFGGVWVKVAILVYAMLEAELLPEL